MKIMEIVDSVIESPLFEMAFQRKAMINRLRSFQFQINAHALKIIAWPNAQEVPQWKHELTTWGNDLAASWLCGRPSRPMGFDLAWRHLYLEPFEGAEDRALEIRLQHIEAESTIPSLPFLSAKSRRRRPSCYPLLMTLRANKSIGSTTFLHPCCITILGIIFKTIQ